MCDQKCVDTKALIAEARELAKYPASCVGPQILNALATALEGAVGENEKLRRLAQLVEKVCPELLEQLEEPTDAKS